MRDSRRFLRIVLVLVMAALPIGLLVGCRGNLGWDRMDGPTGRQVQPG